MLADPAEEPYTRPGAPEEDPSAKDPVTNLDNPATRSPSIEEPIYARKDLEKQIGTTMGEINGSIKEMNKTMDVMKDCLKTLQSDALKGMFQLPSMAPVLISDRRNPIS